MTTEPTLEPGSSGVCDLHLHSTASDGTLPPAEVVQRARDAGLRGLALTDHDTAEGLPEAEAEAAALGLAFLRGAELSANEPGRSVHLLAFGFDPKEPSLVTFLERYREDRLRRAREMLRRLNQLGVPLSWDRVVDETGAAAPTRAHVARALVGSGLVPTMGRVFSHYLSRGQPAFVEKRPTPPSEVIERVHAAGGLVLLAHPGHLHGEREIRRWVEQGLDGVEVRHPEHGPELRARLERLCEQLDLLRSGGSDWHGPDAQRAEIGSQQVPVEWLERIVARCRAS